MEIVPMDANTATLIPTSSRTSLLAWLNLYMRIEAGDPDSNTFKAKVGDLSRLISHFRHVTGSDHADQWTRSVSTGFVKHPLKTRSERTGKRLQRALRPTTRTRLETPRALATLNAIRMGLCDSDVSGGRAAGP
jgi:hypothetical protein